MKYNDSSPNVEPTLLHLKIQRNLVKTSKIISFLFYTKFKFNNVLVRFLGFDSFHTMYPDLHPDKIKCSAKLS